MTPRENDLLTIQGRSPRRRNSLIHDYSNIVKGAQSSSLNFYGDYLPVHDR